MAPLIALLIKSGADPNAVDGAGASALHYAAQYGRVERIAALVEAAGPRLDLNLVGDSVLRQRG